MHSVVSDGGLSPGGQLREGLRDYKRKFAGRESVTGYSWRSRFSISRARRCASFKASAAGDFSQ